jgi:hypothetical protein
MNNDGAPRWFTLEVIFKDWLDGSIRTYRVKNLSAPGLKKIRDEIFFAGFVIRGETPDEFEVISPFAIGKLFITQQEKKFDL